jgi:hypothetical protein
MSIPKRKVRDMYLQDAAEMASTLLDDMHNRSVTDWTDAAHWKVQNAADDLMTAILALRQEDAEINASREVAPDSRDPGPSQEQRL